MNRNLMTIIAIIVLVLIVAFGARYFFGVEEEPIPTATTSSAPEASQPDAQNTQTTDGAAGQQN
jgi:uncharacterized protein YpmB